jgi:hypothetical protein
MGFQEKIYNQLRTMSGTQNRILTGVENIDHKTPEEKSRVQNVINLVASVVSIIGIIGIILDIIQFLGGVK